MGVAKEVAVAALKGLSSMLVLLTEDPRERMLREVRETRRKAQGASAAAATGDDAAGVASAEEERQMETEAANDPEIAASLAERVLRQRQLKARQEAVSRARRERVQREAEILARRRRRLPAHVRTVVQAQVAELKREEAEYRALRREIQRAKLDRLQREERERQREKERERERERERDREEWDAMGAVAAEER
jgi:hypothetical protein